MCWISATEPKYKIAEEDIVVYKEFLEDSFCFVNSKLISVKSVVYDYLYKINEINHPISIKHYFDGFYYIKRGYHSYKNCRKYSSISGLHTIKCIIPKGSHYVINCDDKIVSSNIIVTDEIMKCS